MVKTTEPPSFSFITIQVNDRNVSSRKNKQVNKETSEEIQYLNYIHLIRKSYLFS